MGLKKIQNALCYSSSVVYAPSIMSSTNIMVLRSICGRVACTVVLFTYLFVCVVTAVIVYVPSTISSTKSKNCGRVVARTFFPTGIMFFYVVTKSWNFTSAYVRIQSTNNNRHVERCRVNREEFRE